jgi:hypothetical protein
VPLLPPPQGGMAAAVAVAAVTARAELEAVVAVVACHQPPGCER